jgi:hypothetical protein
MESIQLSDAPAASLAKLCIKFIDLNAYAKSEVSLDSNTIVDEALALETEIGLWETHLHASWEFTIMGPLRFGGASEQSTWSEGYKVIEANRVY